MFQLVSFLSDWTYLTGIDARYVPATEEIPWVVYQPAIEAKEAVKDGEGNIIEEAVEAMDEVEWTYTIPAMPARWREDCIACFEVDFDTREQVLQFTITRDKKTWLETVKSEDIEIADLPERIETPEEKTMRINVAFWNPDVDYTTIDLEWFTWKIDMDYVILARFFGWSRTAESEFIQKMIMSPKDQNVVDLYTKKEAFKEFISSLN